MNILIKKRATGKTLGLLYTSEATGYTIIVDSKSQVENLKNKAKELAITIPEPMTADTFRTGKFHCQPIKGILIDDADSIIKKALFNYFNGANIVAITMSPNDNTLLSDVRSDDQNKKSVCQFYSEGKCRAVLYHPCVDCKGNRISCVWS